jgi:hypothetical protein
MMATSQRSSCQDLLFLLLGGWLVQAVFALPPTGPADPMKHRVAHASRTIEKIVFHDSPPGGIGSLPPAGMKVQERRSSCAGPWAPSSLPCSFSQCFPAVSTGCQSNSTASCRVGISPTSRAVTITPYELSSADRAAPGCAAIAGERPPGTPASNPACVGAAGQLGSGGI